MRVAQGAEPRMHVFFDADCGFCARTARVLRRFDRAGRLELVPITEAAATVPDAPPANVLVARMHVRDSRGRWSIGGAAWLRIARAVPALRPFGAVARVPFVRPFVEPVYALVARNRHRISWLFGDDSCPTPRNAR